MLLRKLIQNLKTIRLKAVKINVFAFIALTSTGFVMLISTAATESSNEKPLHNPHNSKVLKEFELQEVTTQTKCLDYNAKTILGLKKINIPTSLVAACPFYDSHSFNCNWKYANHASWQDFSNVLSPDTFTTFQTLLTANDISIRDVNGLLKCENGQYVVLLGQDGHRRYGAYIAELATSTYKKSALYKEKLTSSPKVMDVFESKQHGIWVLTSGGQAANGLGYEEFALISLRDPKQSFLILSIYHLAPDLEALSSEELLKKHEIDLKSASRLSYDYDNSNGYEITNDGTIKFNVLEKNLNSREVKASAYIVQESVDGLCVKVIEYPGHSSKASR